MPPKRSYGEWLRSKEPVPPKSSRYRFHQIEADELFDENEDNNSRNNEGATAVRIVTYVWLRNYRTILD